MTVPFNTFAAGLPAAGTLAGTEIVPVVKGGVSSQTTVTAVVNYTVSLANVFTADQRISDAEPRLLLNESDQGADLKLWDLDINGGIFTLRTRTDADGAGVNAIAVTRGATTAITNISFGNATNNPSYSFLGSGNITVTGNLTTQGAAGVTTGGVILNGSSVPAVGIYRPAANILGFSTASTARGSIDANGNLILLNAIADQSKSVQVPTTGFAITIANNISTLILNPAGTLASGTITMPATPIDGQEVRFNSSQIVTSLTVSPNTSQTISDAPTAFAAGQGYGFIYHLATTNWFRLY